MIELKATVDRVLDRLGGFYTFEDIIDGIRKGDFQSFALNNSWVVTRIAVFLRKEALEIVFMTGAMGELQVLEEQVINFALEQNITTGLANGRLGFLDKAFPGWKASTATFIKDFTDGQGRRDH